MAKITFYRLKREDRGQPFLNHHCRRTLILAGSAIIIALGVGLWMRIVSLPTRETLNLGRRIWPAAGSPRGDRIALCADLDQGKPGVTVWDLRVRDAVMVLPARTPASKGYAWPRGFSEDGTLLATMEGNGGGWTLVVWEIATGRQVLEVSKDRFIMAVAFSPDNSTIAIQTYEFVPIIGYTKLATIWELGTSRVRFVILDPAMIAGPVYSPDGKRLATTRSGLIRLWDASSGKEQGAIAVSARPYRIAFTPDGQSMAVADSDGFVALRNLKTGSGQILFKSETDEAEVKAFTYSRDGKILMIEEDLHIEFTAAANWPELLRDYLASHTVTLWDMHAGKRLTKLPADHLLTLAEDGRLVTYGCNGTLRWWNLPPADPSTHFLTFTAMALLTLLLTALIWWRASSHGRGQIVRL